MLWVYMCIYINTYTICIHIPYRFIACHVHLCAMCIQPPSRPEENAKSPRTGVTKGYGLPCWDFELNLGLLEEQTTSLTPKLSL